MNEDPTKLPQFDALTDALASGPASPQWQAALRAIGELPPETAEPYRQLLSARERLEQGRDYRSVWAGPGFTRDLNAKLDDVASGRASRVSWGRIVLTLSSVALAAALVSIIWTLRSAQPTPAPATRSSPTDVSFPRQPLITLPLNRPPSSDLAKVDGTWPTRGGRTTHDSYGLTLRRTFAPAERFAVELSVRSPRERDGVVQLLVSTTDPTTGVSLVLRGRQLSVVRADGSIEILADNLRSAGGRLVLRVAMDDTHMRVETDGAPPWDAAHDLPSSPRVLSIRVPAAVATTRPSDDAAMILDTLRIFRP